MKTLKGTLIGFFKLILIAYFLFAVHFGLTTTYIPGAKLGVEWVQTEVPRIITDTTNRLRKVILN